MALLLVEPLGDTTEVTVGLLVGLVDRFDALAVVRAVGSDVPRLAAAVA